MIFNNVITHKNTTKEQKKNNIVIITKHILCYNNVIHICNYIIITLLILLPFSSKAIEIQQPIAQGSYVYGRAQPGERVFLVETYIPEKSALKEIIPTKEGGFVFGLPQDTDDILILKSQKDGQTKTWKIPITKRQWKEEVVNGLPPHKVSPSKEDQERIALDNKALVSARAKISYEKIPLCFSRPAPKNARISSTFGARRILNGIKTTGHGGTDYAMPTGTSIVAPADGTVNLTHDDMFFSGKTVLIDHGYGVFSSYSHLNQIDVEQGQKINRGEKIGEIGTTGRSTGPHLHLTFTWLGTRVDPEFVLQTYPCEP